MDATGGTPRIAMQLIRGPTLEDAAKDLRLDEVVSVLAQVAEAVHGAHQLNLIHRDLKPSNILLQWSDHGGWTPYICDFGLAMALDGPSVTQPLALTGTPAYMAPEQVRGDRSLVGPPTDVYGIGSTLYFALVGRPPCVSTVTAEMLVVKRECRFPTPRSLEPDIPPALEAILFKCMQPAPQDRYATAAELARDLRRVLQSLGRHERPEPDAPRRALAWTRDRKRLLGGLAALVCLAAALPAAGFMLNHRQARRDAVAQAIAVEGANLNQNLLGERLLPVHDLRPADAGVRIRMAALQAGVPSLGRASEGPLEFALGRAAYLLQDLPQAKDRLERAWAAGCRTPDAAFLLAQVQYRVHRELDLQASFQGQGPSAPASAARASAQRFLQLARLQTSHPREYADALEAGLDGDWARAAGAARKALAANAWHLDSAVLGSESLLELARGRLDAGDTDGAETRCQEAMDLAETALAKGQSDPRLHHLRLAAGLGLADLALDRGVLSEGTVAALGRQAELELQLDPGRQAAQSDWLQVASLKAMRLLGLSRDPRAVLDQALQFYWTRTGEPRGMDLRMDHLVLYWLQAERDFARGEDPGPALTEALKDPGHTVARGRDHLGDLLNLKARFTAAKGLDPRPEVEAVVAGFEPSARQEAACDGCETAARAWLTRAEWEFRHRIDPADSLRRAQDQLQRALARRPTSASAHALQGLAQVLEARSQPARRASLLAHAREQLRWSARLNPADRDLARLRSALARG